MQLIGETVFNNFRKCQQGRKRKTVVVGHVPMQDAKKGPPAVYHGLRLSPAVSRWLKNTVSRWEKPKPSALSQLISKRSRYD
jgi:hypothetical protein